MLSSNFALAAGPKAIACPQVLKTVVDKHLHKDWQVYSNDPLDLARAWVMDNSVDGLRDHITNTDIYAWL